MKQLLHDMVSEQCGLHPASAALVFRNDALTYEELQQASNRVARALRALGCGAGDRVAIMMPKSIEAVVSILGTLKAGCIYVPIDPAGPAERTARIFDVCELKCVLAGGRADGKLRELGENGRLPEGTAIGWIEAGTKPDLPAAPGFSLADLDAFSADGVACGRSPEDVAHILFTSGSTGVPKGVPITHANAMHFVRWAQRYFGISASDRISGHPPLIFDLSTFDMYATLGAGASLYLAPPELNLIPHRLADFIRDNELTQWFSVPSILNHMAKHDVVRRNDFPSLKRLLWCGEAFPTPALIYWMQRLPSVSFTNLYGPTEATIASSYYRVPQCPEDPREPVSIGEACDGEELLILDEHLNHTPPGETGHLYIGGVGLSPGYWRDPEKTASVFLKNPSNADPDSRIYKTGDLAKRGEDGLIYLLGRADYQIKCRGHRIELGEIEAALHTLSGLRESAVVAVETGGLEGNTICCAYVPATASTLPPAKLRQRLGRLVPQYMAPTRWASFEKLPLNGSGKIDRRRLKEYFQLELVKAS